MAKLYFVAQIEWIEYEKGGRKIIPPKGARYCPIIRMTDKEQYCDWSIDFLCPDFNETNMIMFTFLVNEAPTGLLELNKFYDIFEGARRVARLKIIRKDVIL